MSSRAIVPNNGYTRSTQTPACSHDLQRSAAVLRLCICATCAYRAV